MNPGKTYQAVFILGGGLKKDGDTWRTTRLDEDGDTFGPTADYLRVIAGSLLFKENKVGNIYTSGGRGQYKDSPETPPLSKVLKTELIALGIPENIILEEDCSGNTYQQLLETRKIIDKRVLTSVAVLSNFWHLPRIKAMIENAPEIRSLESVDLISAEETINTYGEPSLVSAITKAYNEGRFEKRFELEKKGINDIKQGRYKFQ